MELDYEIARMPEGRGLSGCLTYIQQVQALLYACRQAAELGRVPAAWMHDANRPPVAQDKLTPSDNGMSLQTIFEIVDPASSVQGSKGGGGGPSHLLCVISAK